MATKSMGKKGTTKRQHYVPRFLLRNFAMDDRRVSLVVLSTRKRVNDAGLKDQCYQDYFYGEDNVLEKIFANEESKISSILSDLSPARLEAIDEQGLHQLRLFVHYQRARTLGAAISINKRIAAIGNAGKRYLGPQISVRDASKDLAFEKPQIENIVLYTQLTPLLSDLAVKFIVTERTTGFAISDNPVIGYNQFAEHHPRFRNVNGDGIALKGFQFFLPLSPNVVLAIYDCKTYEYGGAKKRIVRAGPMDVRFLNRMQAVNAFECVYFSSCRLCDTDIEDMLAARSAHPTMYSGRTDEIDVVNIPKSGAASPIFTVTGPSMKIGAKLSFIRVMDGLSYEWHDRIHLPVRSEELVAFTENYGAFVRKQLRNRTARADGFSDVHGAASHGVNSKSDEK